MNRRHFLTAMGGATAAAASLIHVNRAFAAETTTSFYVKGLILVSFEDSKVLRLGLPKAPGHKATLAMVPQSGSRQSLTLKGNYSVETDAKAAGKPEYKIPELIRMQELYGNNIHSRVNECPTVISIPYAAIKSIAAADLSPDRYTFVRSDNGQEIVSFRPRKVADTLRIELSSDAVMRAEGGKSMVAMNTMKEVHTEYAPDAPATQAEIDAFAAHFTHYYDYLDRPAGANFQAVPKKLGGKSSPTPHVGNHFAPFYPWYACYVIAI
jgi:hypothetical protein